MDDTIDEILSRIYIEVPEVPDKVIGLSRNMIVEAKAALLSLALSAIPEKRDFDKQPLHLRPYTNGFNAAIDQTTANIHKVFGGSGDGLL